MKRVTKNIISVVLIILMCGAMFFTMNYAKNHTSSNTGNQSEMKEMGGTPPSMNENRNMGEPPEKPSGESNSNGGQPPEMPFNGNSENNMTAPNGSGMPNGAMNENNSSDLDIIYYILFVVESLILSSLIIYLIMSGFNKKTIKETFANKDKALIGVLSIIILTSGFIYLDGKITKDHFLNNTNMGGKW